jgi:hypothetical protein
MRAPINTILHRLARDARHNVPDNLNVPVVAEIISAYGTITATRSLGPEVTGRVALTARASCGRLESRGQSRRVR